MNSTPSRRSGKSRAASSPPQTFAQFMGAVLSPVEVEYPTEGPADYHSALRAISRRWHESGLCTEGDRQLLLRLYEFAPRLQQH